MKKNTTKKKPISQNQKISSYFTRIVNANANKNAATNSSQSNDVKESSQLGVSTEPIVLSDEEDFISSTPKLNSSGSDSEAPKSSKLLKTSDIPNLPSSNTDGEFNSETSTTPERKKRKHLEQNTPSPDLIPCSLNPDEEEKLKNLYNCLGKGPPKRRAVASGNEVCITNLSNLRPDEFRILQSPSRSNSDIKLVETSTSPSVRCKPIETLLEKVRCSPPKPKSILSPPKSATKQPAKAQRKTPRKRKSMSPSKLYSRSPKSLHKFNVEVLENYVAISPSKSDGKRSPLAPLSPTAAARSLEAQRQNESTPTKSPHRMFSITRPQSKVKTKLDFGRDVFDTDVKAGCSRAEDENKPQSVTTVDQQDTDVSCMLNDSWDGDLDEIDHLEHTLNLEEPQHCKVVKVARSHSNLTLTLKSTKDETTALCVVEGFWMHMKLSESDTLYVNAAYDENKSAWCVSNERGLIVYEPDLLISTTSVVGGLFCRRRSILNERFHGFEPSNRVMIVGVLVHKLLQQVLRSGTDMLSEVEVIVKKLVLEKDTIWMCYESALNIEDIEKELMEFSPRIISFMKQYVRKGKTDCRRVNKDDWKGTIDSVQDIEENIWCPELGVKGKVDVSIQSGTVTMPLELKTGRASVSLEHRGQVMLYIMMMNKFGYKVPSGLLLYLREGVLKEIPMTNNEKRDLMILRNELAYYLTRKPGNSKVNDDATEDLNATLVPSELPPPINHHSACGKCPYSTICCTYLRRRGI